MRASEFSKLYQDLLGVRFVDGGRDPKSGLDCLGVVRVYLQRARGTVPPGAFPLDRTETPAADALAWVEADCSRWWDRVGEDAGCATQIGDVVFSIVGVPIGHPHVSVLVYPLAPKLVMSSAPARGVHTVPLDSCLRRGEVVGVYRLRHEARPAVRTAAA